MSRISPEVYEVLEKDDSLVPEARIFYNQTMKKNETDPNGFAAFVAEQRKAEEAEKERKEMHEFEEAFRKKYNCEKYSESTKGSRKRRGKKTNLPDPSAGSSSSDIESKAFSKKVQKLLKGMREDIEREEALTKEHANYKDDDDLLPEVICLEGLDAYDPDVDDINVKVRIRGKILVKTIRRVDKLLDVFTFIAKEHNVPFAHLIIYHDNLPIDINATPRKLKMTCADILEAVIIDPTKVHNNNCIKIKLQSKNSKVKTEIPAHKLDPLSILMKTYAEQKDLPLDKLIFEFDGDRISPDDSANDLDIDDGCVIDVRVKQ